MPLNCCATRTPVSNTRGSRSSPFRAGGDSPFPPPPPLPPPSLPPPLPPPSLAHNSPRVAIVLVASVLVAGSPSPLRRVSVEKEASSPLPSPSSLPLPSPLDSRNPNSMLPTPSCSPPPAAPRTLLSPFWSSPPPSGSVGTRPRVWRLVAASAVRPLRSSHSGLSTTKRAPATCTAPISAGRASSQPHPSAVVRGTATSCAKKMPTPTASWKQAPKSPRSSGGDISLR
mmetsp:Transcript_21485/g.39134  ORF Transcript_21485/g.39134 Transcript_21485/m.39134 type:complete len:228 (-) Transcript_21485:69-752(-)